MANQLSGWKKSATSNTESEEFNMNLSYKGKVALVTGAGSGMGLVTARAFAEAGAAVALADVNETAVRSAAEELIAAGHKAIAIRCNVAAEAEVEAMGRADGVRLWSP